MDIPEATVPESFKVLVRELNSLGLSVEAKGERYAQEEVGMSSAGSELAKAAGSKIVATNELTNPKGKMEVVEPK